MGHFFQVFLSNHLALPGSKSIFDLSQCPPVCLCVCVCVCVHLSAKMDSSEEMYG